MRVIFNPILNEMFIAEKVGAYLNNTRIRALIKKF